MSITKIDREVYSMFVNLRDNGEHKLHRLTEKDFKRLLGGNNDEATIASSQQPYDIRYPTFNIEVKSSQGKGNFMLNDTLPCASSEGKIIYYVFQTYTKELHKSELFIIRGKDITPHTSKEIKLTKLKARDAFTQVFQDNIEIGDGVKMYPRPNFAISCKYVKQLHNQFMEDMKQTLMSKIKDGQ